MFSLAHLSDPHVPPESAPRRRELISKRAIGWINWKRNRHRIHRREVLDALTADIQRHHPDHIAVTGDLAIVSSQSEWQACREWLQGLGTPDFVSLVPGNHDAYTRRAIPGATLAWREYMAGDPGTPDQHGFPYLRRRGPLAIVGCSSAIATAPFMATGRIGREQRDRLRPLLRQLGEESAFRVVLVHHTPIRTSGDLYRRMMDARAFRDLLAETGAEMVLHGHEHLTTLHWVDGPTEPVPIIGVPSASALEHGHRPAAQYNLYEIDGEPGAWSCRMRIRGFNGGELLDLGETSLFDNGRATGTPVSEKGKSSRKPR